ncbi:MAG: alpha-L-fucosidase [Bacteroidales bacterium]|nr:alpha-L-fucosidase [Bacteroidales bacterium]
MKRIFFLLLALSALTVHAQDDMSIEEGVFEPTWQSLSANYQAPDWFADAKLGIWAHWGLQCVPESGDWYARSMYMQDQRVYREHTRRYGHPSEFGMMDFIPMWKAEKFDPEALVKLYKDVGARYFVCMANHHDNFDNYDSKYQPWNSVNMGPHRDIVGEFEKAARQNGLRFGVSNHSSHAWHWFQTAYGYDAYNRTKEDGKGTWWEGYDPQLFYGGYNIVIPSGFTSVDSMSRWHEANDRVWTERIPEMNPQFAKNWFLRCKQLIDDYKPDLLYFDDEKDLPMEHYGLELASHMYNRSMRMNGGRNEAVITSKRLSEEQQKGVVMDCERGAFADISPTPWQTCMCIGSWHYDRRLYERNGYKTAEQIVKTFVDIVSKNGNLLLSIPVRGDGSIDEKEMAFLAEFKAWLDVNGEGIFGSRPWKVYGEGEIKTTNSSSFGENERLLASMGEKEIRFTQKNGAVYAFVLGFPTTDTVVIRSLGRKSAQMNGKRIKKVRMLGTDKAVTWKQADDALYITMPDVENTGKAICFSVI